MADTKETILDVEGMSCGSCVRHVESALRRLAGVDGVQVDLTAGTAKITHAPAAPGIDDMIRAVDGAGYTARVRGS